MPIPWLEPFRRAAASEAKRSIILALATVDALGDPQVRSVVCRQMDDEGRIWISSDARSAKHRQLIEHPRAAALAWFPVTREQFRLQATVEMIDSASVGTARVELWRSLAPATRATFFWPAPGQARKAGDVFPAVCEELDPPPSFEVIVLHPTRVDHLLLGFDPHQARRWERDAHWTPRELNP